MSSITLPYNYEPREYQAPFWNSMSSGCKRALLLWHRRAGKDKTALNYMIAKTQERVGTYYYFLPTYRQAKKIIWDGMDADGFPFLGHVPGNIIASTNETELQIILTNGSIIQLIGANDKKSISRVVGTNPIGCIYSEYSLMSNSKPWDYFRPVLRENGGWAVFIFTPRGKNHAFKLYDAVKRNPDWYVDVRTVRDTWRPDGSPVITPEDIDADRAEGMDEETVQSEYYCSFEGSVQGAYYTSVMEILDKRGAIRDVPWDPRYLVHTAWDLGVSDATTIWFFQMKNKLPCFIDYLEDSSEGLSYYAKELKNRPYVYGCHLGPHDIKVTEWGSGASRVSQAGDIGIHFDVVPKLPLKDGIDMTRMMLPTAIFDNVACSQGLDALRNYRRKWDDELQQYSKTPVHDWASNGADAMRTAAVGLGDGLVVDDPNEERFETAESEFNPIEDYD